MTYGQLVKRYMERLEWLSAPDMRVLLSNVSHGIEKEGARVTPLYELSQTCHPSSLGKSLTHPYVTTDFSEALIEFITPVYYDLKEVFSFLYELHCYVSRNLSNELLWAGSMPCFLPEHNKIPIASYGKSNLGRMKAIYREGLAHRYGRSMQTISGIHYNFSFSEQFWECIPFQGNTLSESRVEGYLGLIRNFKRYSWLLMYLFGASPVVDRSFFSAEYPSYLKDLGKNILYMPFATSLRMGDFGYVNSKHNNIKMEYNTWDGYIRSMKLFLQTDYAPYVDIGVKKESGYLQLNSKLLQIENEHYSDIRPKCSILKNERQISSLLHNGIEYVEVRCLDVNPFECLGISLHDAYFLDIFLVFCTLWESELLTPEETKSIESNFHRVVTHGREPRFCLNIKNKQVNMRDYGLNLLELMLPIAELFDKNINFNSTIYRDSLNQQIQKMHDGEATPSAMLLNKIREADVGYCDFMYKVSRDYYDDFSKYNLSNERMEYFEKLVAQSHKTFQDVETLDKVSFEVFLKQFESLKD